MSFRSRSAERLVGGEILFVTINQKSSQLLSSFEMAEIINLIRQNDRKNKVYFVTKTWRKSNEFRADNN